MKPVAESSRAADTERFEAAVGIWKPKEKGESAFAAPLQSTTQRKHKSLVIHPVKELS